MTYIYKYAYKTGDQIILSSGRPGGTQFDHVTAYGLFKESLRSLETTDPKATVHHLLSVIINMTNSYDRFSNKYVDEQPLLLRRSLRISLHDAKNEFEKAQLHCDQCQFAVDGLAAQLQKEKNRARKNIVIIESIEDKLLEAKISLKNAKKELRIKKSIFDNKIMSKIKAEKYAAGKADALKEIKELEGKLVSQKAIDHYTENNSKSEYFEEILNAILHINQTYYDEAITKLANIYLIERNKQPFSRFSRVGSVALKRENQKEYPVLLLL